MQALDPLPDAGTPQPSRSAQPPAPAHDSHAMDASRDVTTAVECYEQAIGLWRGDPLADVEALFGYLGVTTLRQELVGVLMRYEEVACEPRPGARA